MMSLKARASCLAAAFSGTLGLAAVGYGSAAFAQQEPPQGWFKACTKQEEVDVCNVQFMLRANSGQLLTSVNLIEVTGKVNRRVLQIAVPTGRLVPPGVGLQIDDGNTQKVDYAICVPDRCVAEAPLTDELVNSFKRGSELTLTSVNFQNQPNPVKVTLQGFTGAYDGEPLEQSDLDERQKKLEEFVSKNNEEFAERLKKAQENAKQSQ
ncbi:invasion associated locus B family protein [Chelativorans salis]|uniref:Invasion associated locus B family protein n=1 Tax=Chelativorans salis TaxID=2978478 RepID=A0ABT2LLE5_9HYPH|nr:invasion associated locus B family protein [Chelativorans sp. EGI FJ00035]MCT7375416.1 invasion associated locus B family protein [Chelativorans sp. EGI FJ00035]